MSTSPNDQQTRPPVQTVPVVSPEDVVSKPPPATDDQAVATLRQLAQVADQTTPQSSIKKRSGRAKQSASKRAATEGSTPRQTDASPGAEEGSAAEDDGSDSDVMRNNHLPIVEQAPNPLSLQNIAAVIKGHRFASPDEPRGAKQLPGETPKRRHSTSREELRDLCHQLGELLSRKYAVLVRRHGVRYNANAVMRLVLQSLGASETGSPMPVELKMPRRKPRQQTPQQAPEDSAVMNPDTLPTGQQAREQQQQQQQQHQEQQQPQQLPNQSESKEKEMEGSLRGSLVAAMATSNPIVNPASTPPPILPAPSQLMTSTPRPVNKHSQSREELRVLCDAVGEVLTSKYNITVRKHGGRYNANAVVIRLLQMLGDKDAKSGPLKVEGTPVPTGQQDPTPTPSFTPTLASTDDVTLSVPTIAPDMQHVAISHLHKGDENPLLQ